MQYYIIKTANFTENKTEVIMENRFKKAKLIVLFSVLAMSVHAQSVKLSGEVRPRMEMRKGYKSLVSSNDDFALFTDQRSRINLDYKSDFITSKIVLQDVRTWGSQSQLVNNDGALTTIHEAWGKATINKNIDFKLGRMELAYDDHRILGSVGWAQQARSHDLGLLQYHDSTMKVHLGAAFNQNSPQLITTLYTVGKSYKTMQYLWANRVINNTTLSVLIMNLGNQVQSSTDTYVNHNQTLGFRLIQKLGDKTKLIGAFYYQTGVQGDTLDTEINAFNARLEASHNVSDKISVSGGYEILSGNDMVAGNEQQKAFNPVFGTNHKFNGFMDYFYVGNHAGNVGLQDAFVGAKYKGGKVSLGLDAHFFLSAAPLLDVSHFAETAETKEASAYLGTEFDLSVGTQLNKQAKVKAGYSVLMASESMEELKGGRSDLFNTWGYVMVIFKPVFLNTNSK